MPHDEEGRCEVFSPTTHLFSPTIHIVSLTIHLGWAGACLPSTLFWRPTTPANRRTPLPPRPRKAVEAGAECGYLRSVPHFSTPKRRPSEASSDRTEMFLSATRKRDVPHAKHLSHQHTILMCCESFFVCQKGYFRRDLFQRILIEFDDATRAQEMIRR